MQPRKPPNYTTTAYNAPIPYNYPIRYDGITIINPTWGVRDTVTSNFTPRTGPQTLYTWGTTNITWGNANLTWGGSTTPSWQSRVTP